MVRLFVTPETCVKAQCSIRCWNKGWHSNRKCRLENTLEECGYCREKDGKVVRDRGRGSFSCKCKKEWDKIKGADIAGRRMVRLFVTGAVGLFHANAKRSGTRSRVLVCRNSRTVMPSSGLDTPTIQSNFLIVDGIGIKARTRLNTSWISLTIALVTTPSVRRRWRLCT